MGSGWGGPTKEIIGEDKMITEMAVAEMDIPMGCLGHMVGMVEAHLTVAEEIIPEMRDRIPVMMLLNGIQLARMRKMVGQVLKFKSHLAGGFPRWMGAPGEATEVVVVGVVMELVVVAEEIGVVPVQMMLLLMTGVWVGERLLREVLQSPKPGMDGLEEVVVVGEP
ncbi:uncharacterized protein LOC121267768 isoform X2 [Juglans microcarpa x Juglans regia]|uniref:uncharacterized protein LOC121267768 isoform X2 n=1 Tax=Juglans microcarpa x Juglans regia TaxID=2249226 RepID=UPI001B7DAED1|nr:uncharacterized protein LOC121267768 isoform X2 [Juglans microcarpa x Juglans regia]